MARPFLVPGARASLSGTPDAAWTAGDAMAWTGSGQCPGWWVDNAPMG
jgi:hypothetical protein